MKRGTFKVFLIMMVVTATLMLSSICCFADTFSTNSVSVPEPLSIFLLGAGVAGLVGLKKYFR